MYYKEKEVQNIGGQEIIKPEKAEKFETEQSKQKPIRLISKKEMSNLCMSESVVS